MSFYSEHYVTEKSERFVKKIWVVDNSPNPYTVKNQMVLPNGCFNIAIVKGNGAEVAVADKNYTIPPGLFLCSQMTQAVCVDLKPHTKVIFIQLHAWTPSYFKNISFAQFCNEIKELDSDAHLFNIPLHCLYEDEMELLKEGVNHIFEALSEQVKYTNLIEQFCLLVHSSNADIKVKDAATLLSVSKRSLQQKFKQTTGLTPSKYIKIIKLRSSVDNMAEQGNDQNLTKIAHANNYFDQPHFIRVFKEIVHLTPKKFKPKRYLLAKKNRIARFYNY